MFLHLALKLTSRDDFASLMAIETLSVWFLRHCSETQAIWETLNPKVHTYQLYKYAQTAQVQVAYLNGRLLYTTNLVNGTVALTCWQFKDGK